MPSRYAQGCDPEVRQKKAHKGCAQSPQKGARGGRATAMDPGSAQGRAPGVGARARNGCERHLSLPRHKLICFLATKHVCEWRRMFLCGRGRDCNVPSSISASSFGSVACKLKSRWSLSFELWAVIVPRVLNNRRIRILFSLQFQQIMVRSVLCVINKLWFSIFSSRCW